MYDIGADRSCVTPYTKLVVPDSCAWPIYAPSLDIGGATMRRRAMHVRRPDNRKRVVSGNRGHPRRELTGVDARPASVSSLQRIEQHVHWANSR
jgi:hypothetical protein